MLLLSDAEDAHTRRPAHLLAALFGWDARVRACGKSGSSAAKVTVRPDYCRDVLIERF